MLIKVDPTNGQHSATLTQRDLAMLRVMAHRSMRNAETLSAFVGNCGHDNCEACSLDGDDASDAFDMIAASEE